MTPARSPLIVGLIADTHGLLRPRVLDVFRGVHLIVHAGDVGAPQVLSGLALLAPTQAVCGNVDDPHDPMLPRQRSVAAGRLRLHVSHGHELGRPTPARLLACYDADIIVFGHTHRQVEVRDGDGRLVINPGAAGPKRFDIQPSVARLTIVGRQAEVEFIAL